MFQFGENLAFPVNIKDMKKWNCEQRCLRTWVRAVLHWWCWCCSECCHTFGWEKTNTKLGALSHKLTNITKMESWANLANGNQSNVVFSVLSSSPTGASSEPWQGLKRQAGSTLPWLMNKCYFPCTILFGREQLWKSTVQKSRNTFYFIIILLYYRVFFSPALP